MMSRTEQRICSIVRGSFAFFLCVLLLAAAVTYALQKDLATAILFGVCGLAQMALEIGFPARSTCRYYDAKCPEIVDSGASCATVISPPNASDSETGNQPPRRRSIPAVDLRA